MELHGWRNLARRRCRRRDGKGSGGSALEEWACGGHQEADPPGKCLEEAAASFTVWVSGEWNLWLFLQEDILLVLSDKRFDLEARGKRKRRGFGCILSYIYLGGGVVLRLQGLGLGFSCHLLTLAHP